MGILAGGVWRESTDPLAPSRYVGISEAEWGVYLPSQKPHNGEGLDEAIQRAVAFVGQMPKEDRYQPL
jgi:hypothetical protein